MKRFIVFIIFFNFVMLPVMSATIYKYGNCYGLKNNDGKVILNPEYQNITQLSYTPSKKVVLPMHAMDEVKTKMSKMYRLQKNNRYGVSDNKGRIIFDCKYKKIELNNNGNIVLTNIDETVECAHPIINAAETARDTLVTIVALPVTLIGVCMIPVEAVSKAAGSK